MTAEEFIARAECHDLVVRLGHALDRGTDTDVADLFTADAVAVRPGGETLTGSPAIREAMSKRPSGLVVRHILSNVLVTQTAGETTGFAYVLVYAVPAEGSAPRPLPERPAAAADWKLEFRLTSDGWRIGHWRSDPQLLATQ